MIISMLRVSYTIWNLESFIFLAMKVNNKSLKQFYTCNTRTYQHLKPGWLNVTADFDTHLVELTDKEQHVIWHMCYFFINHIYQWHVAPPLCPAYMSWAFYHDRYY